MLVTFNNVFWQYLDKKILDNVSLTINEGDKIGVIGINGAGKSTFLKLIVDEIQPSKGVIYRKNGLRIAYLPQHVKLNPHKTIFEETTRLSHGVDEYEIASILNKLGLTNHDALVETLSGGEKKRMVLASVLVAPSDLLILDEPTNHLDIPMIAWLEKYLIKYNRAMVLVTHDRYFLERVTKKILEIENGMLYLYETNYAGFLEAKAERLTSLRANERKLSAILKKEAKWMAMNPQARSTKSKERIERFTDFENNLSNILDSLKENESSLELKSATKRMGKKTIIIENLNLSIDNRKLVNNFNYIVNRFDRLGIIGNNGCGKTSLFNSILGLIQPDSGKITIGETICIGYFKQVDKIMESNVKVIDYLKEFGEYINTPDGTLSASALLESYLFTPSIQQSPVSKLSGGEKRRLQLLSVLITNPNVLFLDEPTNDLDVYTIELLENYLENFVGAVLVVSHDRYFLDKVCDHLLIYQDSNLQEYMHTITDYINEDGFKQIRKVSNAKPSKEKNEIPRFTSSEKKEFDMIEQVINDLETKLKEIEVAVNNSGSDYELLLKLTDEKAAINEELNKKINRWEYLEAINEKILLYKEKK